MKHVDNETIDGFDSVDKDQSNVENCFLKRKSKYITNECHEKRKIRKNHLFTCPTDICSSFDYNSFFEGTKGPDMTRKIIHATGKDDLNSSHPIHVDTEDDDRDVKGGNPAKILTSNMYIQQTKNRHCSYSKRKKKLVNYLRMNYNGCSESFGTILKSESDNFLSHGSEHIERVIFDFQKFLEGQYSKIFGKVGKNLANKKLARENQPYTMKELQHFKNDGIQANTLDMKYEEDLCICRWKMNEGELVFVEHFLYNPHTKVKIVKKKKASPSCISNVVPRENSPLCISNVVPRENCLNSNVVPRDISHGNQRIDLIPNKLSMFSIQEQDYMIRNQGQQGQDFVTGNHRHQGSFMQQQMELNQAFLGQNMLPRYFNQPVFIPQSNPYYSLPLCMNQTYVVPGPFMGGMYFNGNEQSIHDELALLEAKMNQQKYQKDLDE